MVDVSVAFLNQRLHLEAWPDDTIASLVSRLEETTGIPASDLTLLLDGICELCPDSTLDRYIPYTATSLDFTARLRGTKYDLAERLALDIDSAITSCIENSLPTAEESILIGLINDFLTAAAAAAIDKDGSRSEEDTWSHLQIFILASLPQSLVRLYLQSPAIGRRAIEIFTSSPRGFLSKRLHRKCAPILLEFCALLASQAGTDDSLYLSCRRTFATLIRLPDPSSLIAHIKYAGTVPDLLPMLTELAGTVITGLSSDPVLVRPGDVTELAAVLHAIAQAVKNCTGRNSPIPMSVYFFDHSQSYKRWMAPLHDIFTNLLSKLDDCLSMVETSLVGQKRSAIRKSSLIVGSPIALVLAEINYFSDIFEWVEVYSIRELLSLRRRGLNIVLLQANRNDRLCWILKHKDLIDPEASKKLVMFMFPENQGRRYEMLIGRSGLMDDSFEQVGQVSADLLRGRALEMRFKKENGMGAGVLREWFYLICREIFGSQNDFFLACPSDRRRFFPNPASSAKPMQLKYFRFCGRVIALALMHRVQVGIVFDRVFFLQLAGESITLEDIKHADPCLYMNCKKLMEMDDELVDSDALGLTFSRDIEESGSRRTIELCPGGKDIVVNCINREQYVDLLIQNYFVTSVSEQLTYFVQGFGDILTYSKNPNYFFQSLELEDFNQLIGGVDRGISVTEWKAHTKYNEYKAKDSQIQWFWKIVEGMTVKQQRGLLFFWTSVKYLPVDGFSGLESKLYIRQCSYLSQEHLPTSRTCFYHLELPRYLSESVMRDRLLLVTEEHISCTFGLA